MIVVDPDQTTSHSTVTAPVSSVTTPMVVVTPITTKAATTGIVVAAEPHFETDLKVMDRKREPTPRKQTKPNRKVLMPSGSEST